MIFALKFVIYFLIFEQNYMAETTTSGSPIRPLGDRVVVRPLTEQEMGTVSASGIIIPDTAKKEKPEQGIVVAVGKGKWNDDGDAYLAMDVAVGDKVVFSKYGFDEVKVDGKEYFIVSESSILGVFTTK